MTRKHRHSDATLAKAFIHPGTPTLAQVIAEISGMETLKPSRRRDLVSGIRRLAAAIGWRVEECPADPVWLRPHIAKVEPASLGVSRKTWTTIVSNAKAGLTCVGLVERERGSPLALSSDWQALWNAALSTGDRNITIPASRFVRFCSSFNIAPGDVSDETARDFRRALELASIRKDPDATTWQAIHAWNRAVDRVPGWPCRRLIKPVRHNHYARPIESFPASFGAELDELARTLGRPVLGARGTRRSPLSQRTIEHRVRQITRFASALVCAGVPQHELRSLSDLLVLARVETGLEWLARERHGGATSAGLHQLALGLCMLGRELAVDDDHLEQLRAIASALSGRSGTRNVRRKGMTAKNRQRLRQFRNPARRNALLTLPAALMELARRTNHPVKAARVAEMALAIGIELIAPIRLKNLAALDLTRHFDRSVPARLFLTLPEYEVKNGAPLEFELPQWLAKILDTFLEAYRDYLIAQPCPWLFAREDGTDAVHGTVLARRIKDTLSKQIGVEMNTHLFRHLAAMLILEHDPGAYDVVRRILGHAELSTTIDAYSGMETIRATRMLADIVDQGDQGASGSR